MPKNLKNILISSVVVIIVGLGITYLISESKKPGQYDDFAKCIAEKKAVFYGAFWCPHCQNQKKLFGKSAKYLPYEECSTPDGNSQLKFCTDKGVQSYPTWEFADGSRVNGEISLQDLATKTGCSLP